MQKIYRLIFLLLFLCVVNPFGATTAAQTLAPPFRLPFTDAPGPNTWLLAQAYGNTTSAYRQRHSIYSAGQGIHFGVDFSTPCGTTIIAIGAGVVAKVDALQHGAAPHNLMIDHDNGYASFYGHLLEKPDLAVGQRVEAGQAIALSGDPDETCVSRPHLHLEIRNAGQYNRAYNPVVLIDADWDSLALLGSIDGSFARDLDHPHRWQTLFDQPDTAFRQFLLNDYQHVWPPEWKR